MSKLDEIRKSVAENRAKNNGVYIPEETPLQAEERRLAEEKRKKEEAERAKQAQESEVRRLAEEKRRKEEEERAREIKEFQLEEMARVRDEMKKVEFDRLVFDLSGCRGRRMKVYTDRAVITTSVTLGAILTNNATDGEKTIFFHDVVGIQYKEPGLTIGYLQLETASGQMNNQASNAFSENTYTFETDVETVRMVKDYIIWQVSQLKK